MTISNRRITRSMTKNAIKNENEPEKKKEFSDSVKCRLIAIMDVHKLHSSLGSRLKMQVVMLADMYNYIDTNMCVACTFDNFINTTIDKYFEFILTLCKPTLSHSISKFINAHIITMTKSIKSIHLKHRAYLTRI